MTTYTYQGYPAQILKHSGDLVEIKVNWRGRPVWVEFRLLVPVED